MKCILQYIDKNKWYEFLDDIEFLFIKYKNVKIEKLGFIGEWKSILRKDFGENKSSISS